MLLLAAIQAYRKQARCKRQLVRVFERHSFLAHGGNVLRVGYSQSERPTSTAITTESSSESVPAASKHTHQTPSPPRFAQGPARSPPQARFCVFDHLLNTQRCGRADSISARKQPPYSTTKASYSVNQLGLKSGREDARSLPIPQEQEQTRDTVEIWRHIQHGTLTRVGKTSDVCALG
jgi:hypothetical protein